MKIAKIALLVLGGLIVLLVVAAIAVTYGIDANKFKPELIEAVKARTGRTLKIDDPLRMSVFPRIGIAVGRMELSEPGGNRAFAKVGEARASLALLPLFSGKIVVDRIVLTGLSAELVRRKDGRTNIDDLVPTGQKEDKASPDAGSGAVKIDIQGIEIAADSIGWSDERDGTRLRLNALKLVTGRIADDVPGKLELNAQVQGEKPKVSVSIDLSAGYRFSTQKKSVALSGVVLKVSGDVPGATGLAATLKGSIDSDPSRKWFKVADLELSATTRDGIEAKLAMPGLEVSPERVAGEKSSGSLKIERPGLSIDAKWALSPVRAGSPDAKAARVEGFGPINFSEFAIDFSGKQGDTAVQGRMVTPLAVQFDKEALQLSALNAEVTASGPQIPQKSVKAVMTGRVDADWGRQSGVGDLLVKLNDSTIKAKVDLASVQGRPAIGFDIDVDQLDVDRYMPAGENPAKGAASNSSKGGAAVADAPIDLAALKSANVHGQFRAGRIVAARVKLDKLAATIRNADGRLTVSPLTATLYGGTLAGSLDVNANGNRIAVRQQLTGVNIGPLLRDAVSKDFIDGRGNVTLDVETNGPSVRAMKKALSGSAAFNLKDGAVKGINLAEIFRNAKSMLGAKSAREQGASGSDKTDFAELLATFRIRNGVAHNDDLSLKSPFIRLGGTGDIDIGNDRMDYLAKASVVDTSGGQGGKDLSQLRGLTIPVRLSGPFDALKYRIDFGAVATEAVKQKVEEKVKDQLQDRLKGLFRR